tara:strand:+ start:1 stop:954 length:954 start_codon:yes stop_codon:yes gene_type:complete
MIPDASLGTAMIENAAITDALIGNTITSNDYIAGSQGWGIFKSKPGRHDGYAEFNDIIARGTIYASHIEAGSINVIDDPNFFSPGVVTDRALTNIQSDNFNSVISGNGRPAAGWGIFKDFGGQWNANTNQWEPGPGNPWNGVKPFEWAEFNNIYARGNIEAQSLKANTAMVETLNVNGSAITAGYSTSPTFTRVNDNYYKVSGWVEPSEHLEGRIQISASLSIELYAPDDDATAGCEVTIYFNDGSPTSSVEEVRGNVQNQQLRLTMPIGFTHTSLGGVMKNKRIGWEVNIKPTLGATWNKNMVPEKAYITRTILKR